MGFIFGLITTYLLAWGLYSFATKPEMRRSMFAEWKTRPFYSAFVFLWSASVLCFFWGVLFNVTFTVNSPFGRLEFSQAAGLVALLGFVCFWFFPRPFG